MTDPVDHTAIRLGDLSPDDLAALARRILPPFVYDYYAGGADEEGTLADNRAAFGRVRLRPRVLVDVSERDLSVRALGEKLSMPVAVAPMAYHRLAHPEGELATTRGVGRSATALVASTMSTTSVEEMAAEASGPLWYQLYVVKDKGASRAMIRRAIAAGCSAVMVTVDATILGRRRRDEINRFTLPADLTIPNLDGLDVPGLPQGQEGSQLAAHFSILMKHDLTWDDLDWIREESGVGLIVKGIVAAEDARIAGENGVDAIVVSNHGGRQLDGTIATLDALEEVVAAAGAQTEVWLDGGVRTGTDVLKALALGARIVLVGRPVLWGLAIGGENGVHAVLEGIREELDRSLALAGCRTPAELSRSHVVR